MRQGKTTRWRWAGGRKAGLVGWMGVLLDGWLFRQVGGGSRLWKWRIKFEIAVGLFGGRGMEDAHGVGEKENVTASWGKSCVWHCFCCVKYGKMSPRRIMLCGKVCDCCLCIPNVCDGLLPFPLSILPPPHAATPTAPALEAHLKRQKVYLFCQSLHAARRPVDGSENKLGAFPRIIHPFWGAHLRSSAHLKCKAALCQKTKKYKIKLCHSQSI